MTVEVDWNKIQNQRAEGVSVAKLAIEHGISGPTIYAHTKAPTNGKHLGKQPKAARLPKPPSLRSTFQIGELIHIKAPARYAGKYAAAIAQLEADRSRIDAAIAALKELRM
jgi:hypothetical protein